MKKGELGLKLIGQPGIGLVTEVIKPDLHITWHKPTKESSQLLGFAYNEEFKTLALKFAKGGVFTYANVDKDKYYTLLTIDSSQTESLGSWIYKNITGGDDNKRKYPFTKEN